MLSDEERDGAASPSEKFHVSPEARWSENARSSPRRLCSMRADGEVRVVLPGGGENALQDRRGPVGVLISGALIGAKALFRAFHVLSTQTFEVVTVIGDGTTVVGDRRGFRDSSTIAGRTLARVAPLCVRP